MRTFAFVLTLLLSIAAYGQQVTLAWDVSASMQDRAIEKEIDFIAAYFKKYPDIEVNLLQFNNLQTTLRNYTVTGGDWSALEEAIRTAKYDGATAYDILGKQTYSGGMLLFTDGKENLERDPVPIKASPLYVINGNVDCDLENLKFLALSNKGRYIGLDIRDVEKPVEKRMMLYKGSVVSDSDGQPIQISVKESGETVTIERSGPYQIPANPGDVLVFSSPGLEAVERTLDSINTINVYLKGDGIQLDEVYLENDRKRDPNQKAIVDGTVVSKDMQGYAVQSIGEEDINTGQATISRAVQGKFSGVTAGVNQDISQSVIRGQMSIFNNNYPLVIIDGAPVARSYSGAGSGIGLQLADFIDVNNVADVTVLKGFAATNKYGSEGSNGVVLITTKMAAERQKAGASGTTLGNTSTYQGKALTEVAPYTTSYLNAIAQTPSQSAAYQMYYKQRDYLGDNPAYLPDLYNHFLNKNPILAQQIAYSAIEKENRSLAELRGLILRSKHPQLTLDLANAQLESFPQQIQSYMDVALANKQAGNYQLALDILLGIEKGTINPNLDFTALQATAYHEICSLVAAHRSKLNTSALRVAHLQKNALDARIVFEWSQPSSQFELQFVNPEKRYFTWEHTLNNEARLKEEKLQGFYSEEFEVTGGEPGVWIVNVKYLGNEEQQDTSPTFLRCTIYHDFGTDKQRKEQRIITLHRIGQENQAVRLTTAN